MPRREPASIKGRDLRDAARRRGALGLLALMLATAAPCASLENELGRSEVRVRSAAFVPPRGRTLEESGLIARLEHQGYRRVRGKPRHPGELFWGSDRAWWFRRASRHAGTDDDARLIGLSLAPNGTITGAIDDAGRTIPLEEAFVPSETLSESLDGTRARTVRVDLDALPDHAWRAVLAAEDGRFFEHGGVDPRSVARAAIADALHGGVSQGGSTITQQLVKNRDLTPKRTMGRKVSEAVRAMAIESDHTKQEILEAYLNSVYYGHVEGLSVYGIGTASRAWLSKPASELTLSEAALFAAMVQGPNRLAPDRHPDAARERRDWVLSRMEELGWISASAARAARSTPVRVKTSSPPRPSAPGVVRWAGEVAREEAPSRAEEGRGFVVETTLDPWLQVRVESLVDAHLKALPVKREGLGVAVVVLDAATGDVLASVGGDPREHDDALDRVRRARRQPGSTVKPLVLLEALEGCGDAGPLFLSTRVEDTPLTLRLPSGPWSPRDADDRTSGIVTVREALVRSLNLPFVRIGARCGFGAVGSRLRALGLDVPRETPPSVVLGSFEATPLEMARAYAAIETLGLLPRVRPVTRVERPGGRGIETVAPASERVSSPSTAYLVRDLLQDAVRRGTAAAANVEGVEEGGKTGTSSERRDAWLAGVADGLSVVVWIGRDDGSPLGLTGSVAAAPLWRDVVAVAVGTVPTVQRSRPDDVVRRAVDDDGLIVDDDSARGRPELYRRSAKPRRDHWWRPDEADPVLR